MSQTVHFQGNPVSVQGTIPQAGAKAQPFTLVAKDLSDVALSQYAGKRKVLNIFPSIDTGVCAASVRKFNQLAAELDNTVVLCISADLPFAQSRFCGAEGLSNVITLSTLRSPDFLEKYGVAISEGALKGLVIHVMATHDTAPWIGRMRVLRKNPEPRPGMPGARILPLKGVGKRNAAAALGLVLQPPCPCTRQLLAQAGCQALG